MYRTLRKKVLFEAAHGQVRTVMLLLRDNGAPLNEKKKNAPIQLGRNATEAGHKSGCKTQSDTLVQHGHSNYIYTN